MISKKYRELGGSRGRSNGGSSRSAVSGRFIAKRAARRHLVPTISKAAGIGDWETVGPRLAIAEVRETVTTSGSGDDAEERLVTALLRQIRSLDLAEVERANGSMDAVAERMIASLPGANILDERVGPFYDTSGLRKWFQMSRQTLDAQATAGDVLCVMSSDNHRLYPSFQFTAQGQLLPRLRQVLAALDPKRIDTWGDAVWLNTPASALDGLRPAEALRTERADEVLGLAKRAGAHQLG